MREGTFQGYIFVIDTDAYAGNFERPLCAYITGQVGECGVGEEYAKMFRKKHPTKDIIFEGLVASVPDEHGCHRPASIYPTPGFWNDGVGNHWLDKDWGKPHVIRAYQKACKEQKLSPKGKPSRYPAYQSVAIFFDDRPTGRNLLLMMRRAREFPEVYAKQREWNDPFKILGFRLVRERVVTEELEVYPAQ
jgi:hypothetical protein